MQAQVIEKFGEPTVFESWEIPTPQTIPLNHVLIRVAASSVNPIDYKIRSGKAAAFAPDFPAILHGDVAGIVVKLGPGVTKFQVGDGVYGCAGGVKGSGGALAEYMVADADLLALKPQSLTLTQAAVMPLVGITAYTAIIHRAQVGPGQKVLIHAGAGGVGHMAVQLARWAGAEVYTTVSKPEKAAIAQELGVIPINYHQKTVEEYVAEYTAGKGFDVVFDTVGKANLERSFEAAAFNGTVVSISTRSTFDLTPLHNKGLSLQVVFMLIPLLYGIDRPSHGEIMKKLSQLVDQGQLRPVIDPHCFDMTEAAAAHRFLESGQAIGKVVLTQENFSN